jgi:hypothetical protein
MWIGTDELWYCYVKIKCDMSDWEEYDRKLSRQIWITLWIITDEKRWYFDIIWGALWIGKNSEIMISGPKWKCYVDWKECHRKFWRPIWRTMWNGRDD